MVDVPTPPTRRGPSTAGRLEFAAAELRSDIGVVLAAVRYNRKIFLTWS